MHCEMLEKCPFYNDKMPMEQGIGSIFKKKYCLSNNVACARYLVLRELGPSKLPASLYPNMLDLAKKLIADAKAQK